MTIDDVATDAGSVIVTKGRYYGGHTALAPEASPMAPGFTVALFDRAGPFSTLAYGAALPMGLLRHMPGLRMKRAAEIYIGAHSTQTDRDPAGRRPTVVRDAVAPIQVVMG